MSKKSRQVAEEIIGIVNKYKAPDAVQTGIVKSVNTDDYTCVVALNANTAGTLTEAVTVNAALEVMEGLVLVPAVNSVVWVANLDGGGNRGLVKCSKLTKAAVTIGNRTLSIDADEIQLNGDQLGGLTKTQELKTQLDKLNNLVAHLVAVITGGPVPEPGNGAASALQTALKAAIAADSVGDFSNIENNNVKHG